jgi:hypothetical protein
MSDHKNLKYKYLVVPLGENSKDGYRAIIPKFENLTVFGDTPEELLDGVLVTIEEELKERKKNKKTIPDPDFVPGNFNGKILIRTSPQIHEQLYLEAQANEMSLNKYVEKKLSKNH